ncbi:MAG: hypothetical protein AAF409_04065 [Pseudomonadota bacterium]
MSAAAIPTRQAAFPEISLHTLVTILFAGAAATVAFDFFGQVLSPLLKSVASPLLGAKLAPVGLAQGVLATITGVPGKELSALGLPYGLHIMTGMIAYPMGWLLVARPAWKTFAPTVHWTVPAAIYGVGLWVLALFIMAHLVVGMPAFLGFTSITWVALWGHILFALVAAGIIEARLPAAKS